MTRDPILPTKINPPPSRADVVLRPRIMETLNEGVTRMPSMTLVSAPAGYGKTTLLASWLCRTNHPVAWLSLEPEDDTIPRFISYLVASLQKVNPSIGKMTEQILRKFGNESFRMDSLIASLINELEIFVRPVVLVFEDYHYIKSSIIHKVVEALVEHTQPHLRLIIVTRRDPPLPLARWRTRHQLIEIRADDLQFRLDETSEFLKHVMKLVLSDDEISLLEKRTEGWVAGLQLAGLSIRNQRNKSNTLTIEGNHRDIADYLMFEVLKQLPKPQRDFLLQTSIVNGLSAQLCNSVTGRDDSQPMLELLEIDNLFIVALDDKREWFRYHHLFAEFLRKQLLAEYPANRVRELHQRASHWFAEHADLPSAIDHALAAKDHKYAACLIAPQSQQWMQRGEISTILKYLNRLPEDLVWNQWDLCLWYGWSYAVRGVLNHAERWTNRLERLITPLIQDATQKENGPIPVEFQNAYAQVLAIRSVIARQNKDFASAVALSEQALRLVPEENADLHTIVSALLSSAVLEAGHFDQAENLLQSTRKNSYRTGNPFITFTLLLNESALAVMRGQLRRAYDLNEEAFQVAQTESMGRLAFLPQLRLGRIHYFWNHLDQSRQYVAAAIEHADVDTNRTPTIRGYITLAWIQNAEGQYPQALQTLADAEQISLKNHLLESAEMVRGVRAQIQFSAGEYEAVARWARSSAWEVIDSSRTSLILSDESFFPYCQILIVSGELPELKRVERLLLWRLKDSERQRRESTILKIRLTQALLHHAGNQPDLVMASLLQALEIAMPENCTRPFLDEGQPLIPYLRHVPYAHSVHKFARKILACVSTGPEYPQLIERLSQQEFNILQLMAQGHTNPEIARKLVLAVSTVRWYAKQIFRKLGVHNRTQAATQARKLELI